MIDQPTAFEEVAANVLKNAQPEPVMGYTIALGHAFDGMTLNGWYDDVEEALQVASTINYNRGEEWHVVPVWRVDLGE